LSEIRCRSTGAPPILSGKHNRRWPDHDHCPDLSSYRLPALIAELRTALLPKACQDRQSLERGSRRSRALSAAHAAFLKRCHDAGRPGRRRCCCSMSPATTTACTRTFMASTCFRCSSRANTAAIPSAQSVRSISLQKLPADCGGGNNYRPPRAATLSRPVDATTARRSPIQDVEPDCNTRVIAS
jgi:hypothetical protein